MPTTDEGLMLGPADPPARSSYTESDRRSHARSSVSRRSESKDTDRSSSKRSVSRSKSVEKSRAKDELEKKKRERSRERSRRESRDRDRDRDRDREKSSRDNGKDVDRDRRRRDKSREKVRDRSGDRRRSRDRDSRRRRSRSRSYDDYDRRRKGKRSDSRKERSRSRSYGRDRDRRRRDRSRDPSHGRNRSRGRDRYGSRHRSRGRSRDRSTSYDRERRESRMDTIREESQSTRFDLTQTIQELMNNTTSTKNFANLFASNNSNDSYNNGLSENSQDGTERKRKKKSRWGGTESDKAFIPGMPTILPSTLDPTQQEAYLVQLQIEEISRKLRTGDLGIPQNPEERSPSPEPIYSSDGKRLNTREFRCRKRLEEQRHVLIQKMQLVNPEFKPPADYKPPVTRVSDKVLIPQEEHPDINFVGLLIGPRGNTLKAMEKETGAKIIIRGKGSIKEGKVGTKNGQPLPGEDEPLHAFITAPNPEAVKKAVDKIKDVIRQGIEVPEGHNDLRRMQLRELAQLNGTLRENDCPRCTNCGSTEHKSWLCPDKPNVTNSIICTVCGSIGHISKDCRAKTGVEGEVPTEDCQAKIDEEYMSLMAELGEGPPPSKQTVDPLAQVHLNRGYSLFDKKPSQPLAIQAAPTTSMATPPVNSMPSSAMGAIAPPPPIPPGWGLSQAIVHSSLGLPIIPPPSAAPPQPPPPAGPPMMPWMSAPQPPPPGGETMNPPIPGTTSLPPPPPPGTGPLPPMIPPPPGTSAPLPPWPGAPGMMPPYGGGWGPGYAPPPPPPCGPPPPGVGLAQPPPPPPPAN